MSQTPSSRSELVGPLLLIGLGLILLFQNIGWLPWSLWEDLIKFWPVILILVGLQLVIQDNRKAEWLTGGVTVVSIIFILLWSMWQTNIPRFNLSVPWRTEVVEQTRDFRLSQSDYDLTSLSSLRLNFEVGAARLDLRDDLTVGLLSIDSLVGPNIEVSVSDQQQEDTLIVDYQLTSPRFSRSGDNQIKARLSDELDLPWSGRVQVGSGQAMISLSQSKLVSLGVEVGAGSATLDFTRQATPAGELDLDVGVGSSRVLLPPGVSFIVEYDVGVGSVVLNDQPISQGLGSSGEYTQIASPSAEPQITLDVDVGAGKVELVAPE